MCLSLVQPSSQTCVGSLPTTSKGHEYILTITDVSTRKVSSRVIVKNILDFFTHYGLPYRVHTDGASYFVGSVLKEQMAGLGIEYCVSSTYHTQSQGAVERAHRTLNGILRKYAIQYSSSWDDVCPIEGYP